MIDRNTNWREIGSVPYTVWRDEILGNGGPAELASRESWQAAGSHSAVMLNKLRAESSFGTAANRNRPAITKNPFSLRAYNDDGTIDSVNEGNVLGYLHFETWAEGVEAATDRITDAAEFAAQTHNANNPYTSTKSIANLIYAFSPPGDDPTKPWNDTEKIIRESVAYLNEITEGDEPMPELTFGLVPEPPYVDMIVTKQRPGQGYNDCPPRHNVGFVPHETQGDPPGDGLVELRWYRDFFSCPNGERCANALVDWCCARDGTAARFNDPNGTREPWASGGTPNVSDPTGWNRYFGSAMRNRIMESCEFIKTDDARLTPEQIAWGAARAAYIADQDNQPWDEYPNPQKYGGVHMMPEHRQLSQTTCGQHADDKAAMIAQAKAIMQRHQESAVSPPKPVYAKPAPIPALAELAAADTSPAVVKVGKSEFVFVADRV
jgi:hypothetical protein